MGNLLPEIKIYLLNVIVFLWGIPLKSEFILLYTKDRQIDGSKLNYLLILDLPMCH